MCIPYQFCHDFDSVNRIEINRYYIMQIVHSGNLLRFQRFIEIRGKTFAVVSLMQYLLTRSMKLSLETFAIVS